MKKRKKGFQTEKTVNTLMEEEECSSFKFQNSDRFFEVENYSNIHLKQLHHTTNFVNMSTVISILSPPL